MLGVTVKLIKVQFNNFDDRFDVHYKIKSKDHPRLTKQIVAIYARDEIEAYKAFRNAIYRKGHNNVIWL